MSAELADYEIDYAHLALNRTTNHIALDFHCPCGSHMCFRTLTGHRS